MTRFTLPSMSPIHSRHVAVIGAGAAGLVAARELRREGHKVVVLEKNDQIGGTWIYTNLVESDPIGIDPKRPVIHSSMYSSLRTNLPREVMGFKDFPFVSRSDGSVDPRRYPGHAEVLKYLKEFAREFGIEEMVRFETEVVNVVLLDNNKWKVRSKKAYHNDYSDEIYDAVVVCNGHHTQPRIAEIPGIESWPGKQIHSHNYRTPEPFRDQVIVLIGSSASAVDICRDIAGVAKEVHVASRSVADETYEKQPGYDNMWRHSMIESAHEDGTVVFRNGNMVLADVILHCTGYKYQFPFLDTNGYVTVDDNRVGPLYKHVFPPGLAPWLSFVALPWKVLPFIMFELQSKWIAGALSGRIMLPSQEEMMEDTKSFYSMLEASGIPKHHTHNLSGYQFEYTDWLAVQSGSEGVEEWRIQMYLFAAEGKLSRVETYRDEWDDHHLISQAQQDFRKYTSLKICSNI
ncbi:flavin-containing monooxygenase FMO GS-OX-like 4 isoform X2 [Mangifera indica]|uniref:flavin-containing monooxygenase FMO GS-OX-like 4 isoform X2 n=1 Tax=Mangifera indica TaxID=29780 RepID=UPI001CFAA258|nr:flavin-containing monooxygenase FMO GS-OX-like 4 isoform X2 [Mangifera indica]